MIPGDTFQAGEGKTESVTRCWVIVELQVLHAFRSAAWPFVDDSFMLPAVLPL